MNRKKPITPEEAKIRMADLCARSEYSEKEIRGKLFRLAIRSRDIDEIIESLIDDGFIDDARYARAFAHDKLVFSGWGRLKIRMALMQKRIDREYISDALDDLDEDEYDEVAEKVARQKAKSLDLSLYEDRVRLYRHLLSRGFESGTASEQVKKLMKE